MSRSVHFGRFLKLFFLHFGQFLKLFSDACPLPVVVSRTTDASCSIRPPMEQRQQRQKGAWPWRRGCRSLVLYLPREGAVRGMLASKRHALPALRLRAACLATLRYLPWEWGLHAHAEAWSDFLVRAWAACLGGDRALPCPTGRCLSRERGQFSAPLPAACSARARILGREPELGLCKKSTPKQFGCSSHTRCHFPREWRIPAREVALIFEKKIRRFS